VSGVAWFIDQPQQHGKQRKNDDKEKHGEEAHLFLVRGWIAFAPIVCPVKHPLFYCKPAQSATWF
jgi:hypothetical protein